MFFKVVNTNPRYKYYKYRIPFLSSKKYLIKWEPGARTPIHHHNGDECEFRIFNGELHETRFNKSGIERNQLKIFKKYHINDEKGFHQMINYNQREIWSIHTYYKKEEKDIYTDWKW